MAGPDEQQTRNTIESPDNSCPFEKRRTVNGGNFDEIFVAPSDVRFLLNFINFTLADSANWGKRYFENGCATVKLFSNYAKQFTTLKFCYSFCRLNLPIMLQAIWNSGTKVRSFSLFIITWFIVCLRSIAPREFSVLSIA